MAKNQTVTLLKSGFTFDTPEEAVLAFETDDASPEIIEYLINAIANGDMNQPTLDLHVSNEGFTVTRVWSEDKWVDYETKWPNATINATDSDAGNGWTRTVLIE